MLIKSQQVESSDALWQQAEVVLSGERLREAVEAEAATLASKARLPGFRPGKVSARAVRQRFGAQLYTETAGRLRAESFQQIADELQLRLAHMPEMSWSHDAAAWPPVGEDLSYQARFELLPEVGATDYSALSLARPTAELTEADVASHIEQLRRRRADWVDVDRPAQLGDQVLASRTARRDGELVDAYSSEEPQPMTLEEPTNASVAGEEAIPERVRCLCGLSAGETGRYVMRLPDDASFGALRGAELELAMRVHAVQEARLPDLDDAFFAAYGVDDGGYEAFVEEVRTQMRRHLDKALRVKTRHRMFDALNRMHRQLPVPETQLEQEMQTLAAKQFGAAPETLRQRARRNVRVGLLLEDIVRREALSAPPAKVDAYIDDLAEDYSDPGAFKQRCRRDPKMMSGIEEAVMQEHAGAWLLERAAVSVEPMDYDAAMRPEPEPEPETEPEPEPASQPQAEPESEPESLRGSPDGERRAEAGAEDGPVPSQDSRHPEQPPQARKGMLGKLRRWLSSDDAGP